MDLMREISVVKLIVKQIFFLVRIVKNMHFVQQLLYKICLEKYGSTLVLIVFTKTLWRTV